MYLPETPVSARLHQWLCTADEVLPSRQCLWAPAGLTPPAVAIQSLVAEISARARQLRPDAELCHIVREIGQVAVEAASDHGTTMLAAGLVSLAEACEEYDLVGTSGQLFAHILAGAKQSCGLSPVPAAMDSDKWLLPIEPNSNKFTFNQLLNLDGISLYLPQILEYWEVAVFSDEGFPPSQELLYLFTVMQGQIAYLAFEMGYGYETLWALAFLVGSLAEAVEQHTTLLDVLSQMLENLNYQVMLWNGAQVVPDAQTDNHLLVTYLLHTSEAELIQACNTINASGGLLTVAGKPDWLGMGTWRITASVATPWQALAQVGRITNCQIQDLSPLCLLDLEEITENSTEIRILEKPRNQASQSPVVKPACSFLACSTELSLAQNLARCGAIVALGHYSPADYMALHRQFPPGAVLVLPNSPETLELWEQLAVTLNNTWVARTTNELQSGFALNSLAQTGVDTNLPPSELAKSLCELAERRISSQRILWLPPGADVRQLVTDFILPQDKSLTLLVGVGGAEVARIVTDVAETIVTAQGFHHTQVEVYPATNTQSSLLVVE